MKDLTDELKIEHVFIQGVQFQEILTDFETAFT